MARRRKESKKNKKSGSCIIPFFWGIVLIVIAYNFLPSGGNIQTSSVSEKPSIDWSSDRNTNLFIERFNKSNPPQTITKEVFQPTMTAGGYTPIFEFGDITVEIGWVEASRYISIESNAEYSRDAKDLFRKYARSTITA